MSFVARWQLNQIENTNLIGRQFPEDLDRLVEIVHNVLLRIILVVAAGLQCADTGTYPSQSMLSQLK